MEEGGGARQREEDGERMGKGGEEDGEEDRERMGKGGEGARDQRSRTSVRRFFSLQFAMPITNVSSGVAKLL